MTFPVRILQISETCEPAIIPVASGMSVLFEGYGITSIFSVLVKELLDHLSADGGGDKFWQVSDGSG
jgi:condensin complex subunit 1